MKKFKKLLSIALCFSMLTAVHISANATDSIEEATIVATYNTSAERSEIEQQIRAQNPQALIFYSVEEKDAYFAGLENLVLDESSRNPLPPSIKRATVTRRDFIISGTTSYLNRLNFYYSYNVEDNRFFHSEIANSVAFTYTGFTPGTTASLVTHSIIKESRNCLDIKFKINTQYYLLVDGFVQLGSKDTNYHFKNDLALGHYPV